MNEGTKLSITTVVNLVYYIIKLRTQICPNIKLRVTVGEQLLKLMVIKTAFIE